MPTFKSDHDFLTANSRSITLQNSDGGAIIVAPDWQGRVMTSTWDVRRGPSMGFVNRNWIQSNRNWDHMNPIGGEDRIWFGPEAGQFSFFFKNGDPFDLDHWQTPSVIDTDPYELTNSTKTRATFLKESSLTNYQGNTLEFRLDRKVSILQRLHAEQILGVPLSPRLKAIAYEVCNTMTNIGGQAWTQSHGQISIWSIGMFNRSQSTTVIIPMKSGSTYQRGIHVNDGYFGSIPRSRLKIRPNAIYLKADGKYRCKLGLSPARAKDLVASFDASQMALTLTRFLRPCGNKPYINSMWETQTNPYDGDVINSYNDGPASASAKALGPFYELEHSSPALGLEPQESAVHWGRTVHLHGDLLSLAQVADAVLGVDLFTIARASFWQKS